MRRAEGGAAGKQQTPSFCVCVAVFLGRAWFFDLLMTRSVLQHYMIKASTDVP